MAILQAHRDVIAHNTQGLGLAQVGRLDHFDPCDLQGLLWRVSDRTVSDVLT